MSVSLGRRIRPQELTVRAGLDRLAGIVERTVVAEGERGQGVRALPCRAEGGRPGIATVDAERLVASFEPAATEAAQHDVLPDAQHREIRSSIGVDVDRIRPGHTGHVRQRIRQPLEPEWSGHLASVQEETGRLAAAREEQLRLAVVVAIEDGHATADDVDVLALVLVVDAGGRGLIDVVGGWEGRGGATERSHQDERDDRRGGEDKDHADDEQRRPDGAIHRSASLQGDRADVPLDTTGASDDSITGLFVKRNTNPGADPPG